jgi:hypothetical protein
MTLLRVMNLSEQEFWWDLSDIWAQQQPRKCETAYAYGGLSVYTPTVNGNMY